MKDEEVPIENTLNHADMVHPNVIGHRQRLANTIDAEEAAEQEIRMSSMSDYDFLKLPR